MKRELLILRHGKAERGKRSQDFLRPITDPGKRGAQRMGVWLLRKGLSPDHIISSPAERAIETARKCCKAMGMWTGSIIEDARIYDASVQALVEVLEDVPSKAQRVMMVGHNPALDRLIAYADGRQPHLKTADLARLEMPKDWRALESGCSRLVSVTEAKSLPEKFPFPGAESDELRDRPAYYYTQSSVIPYRTKDDSIEILIVKSSKKKHWVVPKGIHDPGSSYQESAAKEAWEEAGIEGEIGDRALGSYVYEKWGAECTCHVYAMEVTNVVSEKEWPESHRGRQWVTPEDAAANLKQPALGPMIETLVGTLQGG